MQLTNQPYKPVVSATRPDARMRKAWCEWLQALATDAEAALAAAIAYRQLDGLARDRWLNALDEDVGQLHVPRIAVYAPLLAVEADSERRSRIVSAMGPSDEKATPRVPARGLSGTHRKGLRVSTIVMPLYLDFVQVLACAYEANGFAWVRHDPIVDREGAPRVGDEIDGVVLESTPLKPLIDELAHAVLAHRRGGRPLPEALKVFADLFEPSFGGSSAPLSW